MRYQVQQGDTLESVAERYTIGGDAYAPAIANTNSISAIYPGMVIDIPDGWLKPGITGSTIGSSSTGALLGGLNIPVIVAAVAAVVVLVVLTDEKK